MREKRVDARVANVAGRQHGVVTTDQLRRCGLDKSAIWRRVAAGRLHPVHRGVYAVGHAALSERGLWKAAALACGDGCALSHRSAGELWGMLAHRDGPIHVTVAVAGGRGARAGLRVHRRPAIGPSEITMRHGIPVTRPGRTLLDLRATVDQDILRRAARQAGILNLPLGEFVWDRVTSPLEDLFVRLCRRARLPDPEINVRIGRDLVDFVWSPQRLVVETDGYRYHHGPVAFEDDRARDNRLTALGYEVLRFTHAMLTNEPRESIVLVRERLRARDRRVVLG
jgi:very-short-patch-repair endonuclease